MYHGDTIFLSKLHNFQFFTFTFVASKNYNYEKSTIYHVNGNCSNCLSQ
jgi:hypothetical protein